MRKMISFKLENLPYKQQKLVDEWADQQTNIQQSLANLVMHVVSMTGNVDIMDFDVQRKLHTIFAVSQQVRTTPVQDQGNKTTQNEEPTNNEDRDVYSKAASLFEEE